MWNNRAEVSAGEVIDKITILNVKLLKIEDINKIRNIQYELEVLSETYVEILNSLNIEDQQKLKGMKSNLFAINLRLWDIKDKIREYGDQLFNSIGEHSGLFNEFIFSLEPKQLPMANSFMLLARDSYLVNGERFNLKTLVNVLAKSPIVEEKLH